MGGALWTEILQPGALIQKRSHWTAQLWGGGGGGGGCHIISPPIVRLSSVYHRMCSTHKPMLSIQCYAEYAASGAGKKFKVHDNHPARGTDSHTTHQNTYKFQNTYTKSKSQLSNLSIISSTVKSKPISCPCSPKR